MPLSLWRRLAAFVAPMIAGNAIELLSGTATAAMLGRLVGAHGLASSGVIYPMTMLCYSFAMGLTSGATILVARAKGANDETAVERLVLEAIALAVAAGALFAFIGVAFGAPILHALGTPAILFAQTLSYLRIVSLSMIVFLPYMMYGALLRGFGDSKTPFKMLAAATTLTVVLMPVLILGPFGLPRLGVFGAPLAALVAIGCVLIAGTLGIPRLHAEFALRPRSARAIVPGWRTARDVVALGLPIAFQYIAVSVSELILLSIVDASGATAVAVYAAMNQIVAYVMTPMTMIGTAVSAFAGEELGADRVREIPATASTAAIMMLGLTGTLTVLVFAFAKPLLGLFLSAPAAVQLAQHATFAMLWSVPILGIGTIASALARSEKHAVGPMIANAIGVLLVLLPCAKFLVARHGVIGVWQAYPIAYVSIAAMEIAYFLYVWRRIVPAAQPAT